MKELNVWRPVELDGIDSLFAMGHCKLILGDYDALSIHCGMSPEDISFGEIGSPYILGSYTSIWRVLSGPELVAGSKYLDLTRSQMFEKLRALKVGMLNSIGFNSIGDVRIKTTNNFAIEFFRTLPPDGDEFFHIFMPGNTVAILADRGWKVGPSDTPWGD
ncbi:hypothetical protein [Aquilutibacter rugosus]|uniref:hypothetical protein n=1 Tax=Aquilutibacter rugosus TaxID=3115820 RepID=UPI002F3F0683